MNPLQSIIDLAQLEGDLTFGARAADADVIQKKLGVTSKSWCAVSSWIVIEVEGAPDAAHVPPMVPLVLYGKIVATGGDDGVDVGDDAFSTYAVRYDKGPIFETPSDVYILVGAGRRVSVGLKTVKAAQSFVRESTAGDT